MVVPIRALSVGSAVRAGDFEATVHSVFRSALNLEVRADLPLVTLLLEREADLPQGIRLAAPPGFSFEGIPSESRAVCSDETLILGDWFWIDLHGTPRWNCSLSELKVDLSQPAVANAWWEAWQALVQRRNRPPGAEGAHAALVRQYHDHAIGDLVRATAELDHSGLAALGSLIGLGSGLTPSGDDFVMGYLLGLGCAAGERVEHKRFLSAAGKIACQLSTQTNGISRTYLLLAASGQAPRRLVELIRQISAGIDLAEVGMATKAAMRQGHSSGVAAVHGLLLGLAAWSTRHLRPGASLRWPHEGPGRAGLALDSTFSESTY